MSAAELAGLCENLSLADEDGEVLEVAEEAQLDEVEDVDPEQILAERPVALEEKPDSYGETRGFWEYWGKFIRVKVQLDILKPLKRWLRLKLDKSKNIVVVGLKYERLPDFCFACGRIGHVIKECTDEEAKKGVLEGSITKFGPWLKASGPEKLKPCFQGPFSGSLVSQNGESTSAVMARRKMTAEDESEGGPSSGPILDLKKLKDKGLSLEEEETRPNKLDISLRKNNQVQTESIVVRVTPKKSISKRWKKLARGGEQQMIAGKISSPLQRMLEAGKIVRKITKHQHPYSPIKKKSPSKSKSFTKPKSPIHSSQNSLFEGGFPALQEKGQFQPPRE
ncbi:hypothetical protein EZV62_018924 [Acer yangbiense]|uniref:CCHC-type domain-containing protein n=1 Tax=Acer yangbiense TaxID=1000413 RepID=A0A5C7H9K6_9ROSI|nr:hypothetical protein EZV62_018924 [Acer yangbiense]